MQMSKMSANGQITVPAAIRRVLGVGPGDRVMFSQNPDGEVVIAKAAITTAEAPQQHMPTAWFGPQSEMDEYGRILEELRKRGSSSESSGADSAPATETSQLG